MLLLACDEASSEGEPTDAAIDGGDTDGEPDAADDGGGQDTDPDSGSDSGPPDPGVPPPTTFEQTIVPLLGADPLSGTDRTGWGLYEIGPGEPHAERDDLGVGQGTGDPTGDPSSLAFFWQLTDIHLIDEESPARLINGDQLFESAYRTQEAWAAQIFEATVRTGNALHARTPLDFAVLTGDMVDNIQWNELGWLRSIMEGGPVDPDTAAADDPIPGQANDPHDAFEARGIARDLPWYVARGNHDAIILGAFGSPVGLIASPTGTQVSALSAAVVPTCLDEPWFETESPVPKRCYMPAKTYFKKKQVVADADRRFFDRAEWLESFFGTASVPDGHGFTADNLTKKTAYYSVSGAVPGAPVRLVVLDTTAATLDGGEIGGAELAWLEDTLTAAEGNAEIVVVASHHPAGGIASPGAERLVSALNAHPNVVLHIAGHTHVNRVTPHPAPDGMPPENGYWEIETSSVLDWPQQTRLIEIVDNRDGTGSVYSTMLDYRIPKDMPFLDGGRFYALFEQQGGGGQMVLGGPSDRNVILRVAWPEDVAAALAALPQREVATLSF